MLGAVLTLEIGVALLGLRPSARFIPSFELQGTYTGMLRHLRTLRLLGGFTVGFALFLAFTAVFTYLPFHLSAPPFSFSQTAIGLIYLVYIAGVISSALSSLLATRLSQSAVMVAGLVVLLANFGTLVNRSGLLILALLVLCFGNFAAQGAATTFVATEAEHNRGGASSLYLFFYYVGGGLGAFVAGLLLPHFGWLGVLFCTTLALLLGIGAAYMFCKPQLRANPASSWR